jgi:hypothetical protein
MTNKAYTLVKHENPGMQIAEFVVNPADETHVQVHRERWHRGLPDQVVIDHCPVLTRDARKWYRDMLGDGWRLAKSDLETLRKFRGTAGPSRGGINND